MSTQTPALAYTNRRGQIYYLHEGLTKAGKRRYFVAKTIGDGALAQLPDGFELSESINGVVSVRRLDPKAARIPAADLARVQTELARHPHLRHHRADAVKDEIIVFEPIDRATSRYSPVMKLVLGDGDYVIYRMTYRGSGGWSYPLGGGALDKVVRKYVPKIGTDAFFELM